MIDFEAADKKIKDGWAAICCMCEHFWEHKDKFGHQNCGRECGGPIVQKAFPYYKGPWTNKTAFCFVCGGSSNASVEIGRSGVIGVCDEHVESIKRMLRSSPKDVVIREEGVPLL